MAIAAFSYNCKQKNLLLPFSFCSVYNLFISFDTILTETPADV